MSSFLDRQTILHKDIESTIYSRKMHYPDKNLFTKYVSVILDETVQYDPSMNDYFNRIKPNFEKETVSEQTKEYAFSYSEYLKTIQNSSKRFQQRNCPKISIDLPEIISYNELGGRLI